MSLVGRIRALNALLDDLPKLGNIHSARDSHALFTWRQCLSERSTSLLAGLGLLECALSDDRHLKAFLVLRTVAARGIPLQEGDLAVRAEEYSGNG